MSLLASVLFALYPFQQKLEQLGNWLKTFGVPGLFVLTLLDSAFVPTAGAPDALLLVLASSGQAFSAAAAATIGSTVGCVILYYMSRAAGEAALSRFGAARRDSAQRLLAKYDALTVLVAAILPPPFPFKVFIIAAGVFRFRVSRLAVAVLVGRIFRYGLLAALAYRYGNEAKKLFADHYPTIGLGMAVALIIGLIIYSLVKRRRGGPVPTTPEKV